MSLQLGRKPARHDRRTMRGALVMSKHLTSLAPPPAVSNDYVAAVDAVTKGNWGMMGNDTLGDCTMADGAHQIMLHTANSSSAIVIPAEADVVAAYSAATGYNPADPNTDQGGVEADICAFMQTTGICGHKSDGWGNIEPSNLDHVRWAVQLFGACRIGVNLPQEAMDATDAKEPWDIGGNTTILGGHDVPIVKYDSSYFYVVTWGKLQAVTPAFIAAYCDEAHAEVYADWISAAGVSPSGFNLSLLLADLAEVDAAAA